MGKMRNVAIVGGGVTGTALYNVLAEYTNVRDVLLIEQHPGLARLNSNSKWNSQTLHEGDIETNYSRDRVPQVKDAAGLVANYASHLPETQIVRRCPKMVLGVDSEEIDLIWNRWDSVQDVFPALRFVEGKELALLEPKVMEDRTESAAALYSNNGYAVAFDKLSYSFAYGTDKKDKGFDIALETRVNAIEKTKDGHVIKTNKGDVEARAVVISSGTTSLAFAHRLGYGHGLGALPVAGNFYYGQTDRGEALVRSKVYTVQNDKLPFAALHADPDINAPDKTRFGPTARLLPAFERYNARTSLEFVREFGIDGDVALAVGKLLVDEDTGPFIARNALYDAPFIGKRVFLDEARKIVPALKPQNIKFAKGVGGIRHQLVDKRNHTLGKKEAKVVGNGIIFNMTPSPGATSCLQNAENDAKTIVGLLGDPLEFDQAAFDRNLRLPDPLA
ncbi:MAG: FAD-dependent oxidoreductase [Candidatus Aenigmarchaeota archaeon]|nr:FAD-dependent oxidoreductase [Candidatus Aenigmarchaeota archaeon]